MFVIDCLKGLDEIVEKSIIEHSYCNRYDDGRARKEVESNIGAGMRLRLGEEMTW